MAAPVLHLVLHEVGGVDECMEAAEAHSHPVIHWQPWQGTACSCQCL